MSKNIYLVVSAFCLSLIGFALFLQYVGWEGVLYQPCPLCILQRVAYLVIAKACLWAYFFSAWRRYIHGIACIFSLFGVAVALRHMWVIYHPTISCGLDPLEVWINQWSLVHWLGWLLKADGLCSAPLPPILGLTVPVWSLIWLSVLTAIFFAKIPKLSR